MAVDPKHIVIVGAGIIGVSTAYYLTKHPSYTGQPITLIDSTGVAAAASGKAGGLLAMDWHEKETSPLAALSYRLHESLAQEYPDRWGYRKLDTLSVRTSPKGKAGVKLKQEIDWLDQSIVEKVNVLGTTDSTAQVHPRKFCRGLLSEAKGVNLIVAKVVAVNPGVATVETSPGVLEDMSSDCIIVCAGPWTERLLNVPITSVRAHSITVLTPKPVTPHALFTDMRLADGSNVNPEFYARQDEIYICGEGDEDVPLPDKASDVQVDMARCGALKQYADALSPFFRDAEIGVQQACYLPTSPTPLVGKLQQGVYVASGHSCWGICLGPGTGKVMSEIIFEGKAKSADVKLLDP
ncbi:FAD dependent oxidoreductase, partial [Protomyces lactucae-debilis]